MVGVTRTLREAFFRVTIPFDRLKTKMQHNKYKKEGKKVEEEERRREGRGTKRESMVHSTDEK